VTADTPGGAPTPAPPRRSLWRHPDFLKLWIGDTVSQFGSQITALAVPLAAAIVLQATPAQMGILAALETLPFLLVSLPAGAWVDRLRRRPVLISGDLVRAVALLAVPVTAVTGHLSMPVLYAVALVTGTATVFFDVAYQAYLPSLVERDQLVDGNGKLELSRSAAQFAGPGIAGALVGWLTAPVAILFDAISFLFSAVMLWFIRKPEPPPVADPAAPRRHIVAEIREGLGVVLRNPVLRAIAASIALSNLFSSMAFATLILFVTRDQGLGAVEIGLAFGLANLGAIAGALVSERIANRLGVGRTLIATDLVGGIALLAVPLASPAYAFAALVVGLGISSLTQTAFNIVQVSLRQSITPDRLQGRMNATMRFFIWGVMPIGSLIGGGLATAIGIREAILFSCAAALTGVLPLLLRPLRSMREPPPPWQEDEA